MIVFSSDTKLVTFKPYFCGFLLISCLTFPLGLFLPYGLSRLAGQHHSSVAWCWGINGFASVMGVQLAPIVAMELGITGLLSLAYAVMLALD